MGVLRISGLCRVGTSCRRDDSPGLIHTAFSFKDGAGDDLLPFALYDIRVFNLAPYLDRDVLILRRLL